MCTDRPGHDLGEFGLKRRRQADHLRIDGPTQNHGAAAAFLVQDGGDAEAGFLDQESLYAVAGPGDGRRGQRGGAADACDLADAVLELGAELLRIYPPARLQLVDPAGTQLGQLLIQTHLR